MIKKIFKSILIFAIVIFIFVIPIFINIAFKKDFGIWWLVSEWSAGDALNFYGVILTFIGTISLGIVSTSQTNKANEMNKRIIEKELLENYCFVQLKNKIYLKVKHNNDCKITMSAFHKYDNGATILLEDFNSNVKKLNEYYLKFYFKDCSKTLIKKININNVLCVQEADKNGMEWEDGSKDPIPCALNIKFNKDVKINWISEKDFFMHMKVYSPENGRITHMLENKVPFYLIFKLQLNSITNVATEIQFKVRFIKKDRIKISYSNANIIREWIIDNEIINNRGDSDEK